MTAPVILVEASPRQSSDGLAVTVRLAGGGAEMPYRYADQHWQAGISGLPRSSASLDFDGEQLGGGGSGEAIEVSWAASTISALSAVADLYWTDAPITVRVGPEGTALPPIATTGLVMETAVDTGVFRIALGDQMADLKRPVLVDRFAGTGGLEGPPEFADLIKSRAWGRCFNVPGRQLDAAHNIWCFGDPWHRWLSFDAIRDKGVAASAATLTVLDAQASPDATFQALQAAPVLPGGAVLCPSIACVKWWTTPAGDLHADIRGEISGGYVETAPEIVARLVAARSTIPFAEGAVAAAVAARPAPFGWRVDTDSATAAGEISEILGGVSTSWLLVDGAIIFRHWDWKAPTRVARSFAVTRKSSVKPTASRKLGYRRNWAPMARGDLAAIVLVQDITYEDGTPIADAIDHAGQTADWNQVTGENKPADNATVGGTIGVNIMILDQLLPAAPGQILNELLELTPAGQLQYTDPLGEAKALGHLRLDAMGLKLTPAGQLQYTSPLGDIVPIGTLKLEDVGAASAASSRQLDRDLNRLSTAIQTALNEASRTRAIFTNAGIVVDPATGVVTISAVQQTTEAVSEVSLRLSAAQAEIALRATTTSVDNKIALALLNPSQYPIYSGIELRVSSVEITLNAMASTITSKASNITVDALGARVTTAESTLDAVTGQISTKVGRTDFDALGARVSGAEQTLSAIGDGASITSTVSASRALSKDLDAAGKSSLGALLNGDLTNRATLAAIATARQELTAKINDDLSAEALARLSLAVRVGLAEAQAVSETTARIDAYGALVTQITQLAATLSDTGAAVTSEAAARVAADGTLTAGLSDSIALSRTLGANTAAAGESALNALLAGDTTRRADGAALAAARTELTAKINGDVDVVVQRVTALLARMGASEASLIDEQIVRAAVDSALSQSILKLSATVGDNSAGIETTNIALVDGDKALADRIDLMQVRVGDAEASVRDETQTRIDGDGALAADIRTLKSRVGDAEASVRDETQTRIDKDGALAADIRTLDTRLGDAEATVRDETQARADGDEAIAIDVKTLKTRLGDAEAAVEREALARAGADGTLTAGVSDSIALSRTLGADTAAAGTSALNALLTGDKTRRTDSAALAAARSELTAKINGDVDVVVQRVTALLARMGISEASLIDEQIVRAAVDSALSQSILKLSATVGDNSAGIETTNIALVDGDKALADRIDLMQVRVGDAEASVRDETQTRIDGDGALAADIRTLKSRVGDAEATVRDETQTRIDGDDALAENIRILSARVGDTEATARDETQTRIDGDSALAENIRILTTRVGDAEGSITEETRTRIDGDKVIADDVKTLKTTSDGHTATLQTQAESIDGLSVRYGVRLDVNGHVTGFVANNDGREGDMVFVFDKTSILRPDGTVLFRAGSLAAGEDPNVVFMPNVEVDRLKINTAVIPAFVSMNTTITGPGWSDTAGDGGGSGGTTGPNKDLG